MSNEGRICPQCGYGRQPKDLAPDYECPRCGIIYAKYVAPKPPVPSPGESPLMPATPPLPMKSPAAASPAVSEEEADAVEIAEMLWADGNTDEAIAELEKLLQDTPDSHPAHLLLAQIYFGEEKPASGLAAKIPDRLKSLQKRKKPSKVNPYAVKALFHASRARELGGENDTETIAILADALMQNRRSEEALTLLEETAARNPDNLTLWELQIENFRERWGLGTVWQFFNKDSLVFEAKSVEAIRQRLLQGKIPIRAKCRKNRVGTLKNLTESIGQEEDRIHILFQPFWHHVGKGALWGAYVFGTIYGLAAGTVYAVMVVKEAMSPGYIQFFLSHLLIMIGCIVFFGWLCLAIFALIFCVIVALGGAFGGLAGAIVGAPLGAVIGLLRWPFLPKLKAP